MADRNYISFDDPARCNDTEQHLGELLLDQSITWASCLKITAGVRNLTVSSPMVPGGTDACVDINNRAYRPRVTIGEARPAGQFAATIKGGVVEPYLEIRRLLTRGTVADVILGDWSDQSHDPVIRPELNITPADGRPVRVLVLKSERPVFTPGSGPYVYLFPSPNLPAHAAFVFGFETLRRWGFFRGRAN